MPEAIRGEHHQGDKSMETKKSQKKWEKTEVEKKEASSVGYNGSFASTPFSVSLICTYSQCSVVAVNFVLRSRRLGL
jgi:hypothetical protein